jgi:TonB family protein
LTLPFLSCIGFAMKPLMILAPLVASLAAVPASAQSSVDYPSSGPWKISKFSDACTMALFGNIEGPSSHGVILMADGVVAIYALARDWSFVEDRKYRVAIRFGWTEPYAFDAVGTRQNEKTGWQVIRPKQEVWSMLQGSSDLIVRLAPGGIRKLPMPDAPAALAALERCVATIPGPARTPVRPVLPTASPVDRGSGKPAKTPPAMTSDASALMTQDDYLEVPMRGGIGGRAVVSLTISAKGLVSGCAIVKSTGNTDLDTQTCALFIKRSRFAPARDVDGNPTEAVIQRAITWRPPD